jgi:3-methylcrotonyl-CoA carboxylase beta subunit
VVMISATRRLYHDASVLPSLISTTSPEFQQKAESMDVLVADLKAKIAQAREGGGPKAQERMRSKGKKLPRERSVPVILEDPGGLNFNEPWLDCRYF